MNVLVFDIETIPDIEGIQKIYNLEGLDDESTAKAMHHMHQQKTGSTFLPLHLQKIAAISIVYRGMGDDMDHEVSIKTLGFIDSTEAELLTAFISELKDHSPTLVSWNGKGFDLPVIQYRLLKNEISAPDYLSYSLHNSQNPSLSHALNHNSENHIDLKEVLSSNKQEAAASLDDMATLLGFPGKMGMDGSKVWDEYKAGNIKGIRDYCETDCLNTYLIYLRYQLMCGELKKEELEQEFILLRDALARQNEAGQTHLGAFSTAW